MSGEVSQSVANQLALLNTNVKVLGGTALIITGISTLGIHKSPAGLAILATPNDLGVACCVGTLLFFGVQLGTGFISNGLKSGGIFPSRIIPMRIVFILKFDN